MGAGLFPSAGSRGSPCVLSQLLEAVRGERDSGKMTHGRGGGVMWRGAAGALGEAASPCPHSFPARLCPLCVWRKVACTRMWLLTCMLHRAVPMPCQGLAGTWVVTLLGPTLSPVAGRAGTDG
jgi:hypothetical protein